jgi:uncharacterized membrane protein
VTSYKPGASARRRVAVSALVGAVAAVLSALALPRQLVPLVGWDVAALTYLVWVWRTIAHLDAEATARHAVREDPTRTATDLLLLSASSASLLAVGSVLVRVGSAGGLREGLQVGFAVVSLLVSWGVIHTVYTLRYARLYYTGVRGGVDFHQEAAPRFSDFAYLAFTIGMTFQVSDTEVNAASIRAQILRHALLSYLFGTVIVALTINLVAGLSR